MADGTGHAPDTTLLQWAIGLVVSILVAINGWFWLRVQSLETKIDHSNEASAKRTADAIDKIWSAIDADRREGSAHRTAMLTTLREVPTRSDLEHMEARLTKQIDRPATPR